MRLPFFPDHSRHITLGSHKVVFWNGAYRVEQKALQTHMHVMGKTGSGKSNFLADFFIKLFNAGMGATLLDPHGDLSKLIFARLVEQGVFDTKEGYNRVVYLDLPSAELERRYLPFNILNSEDDDDVIATNVRDSFHRAFPELAHGAANFDTLLFDTVLLLVHKQLPLTLAHKVLTDDQFRSTMLSNEHDHYLVESFRLVYDQLKLSDRITYAGSLLRRMRQLTQLRVLRYGLSQKHMLLDFLPLMNKQKTVIVNLKVQSLDARRLLGCFLMVAGEQAAMARSRQSPDSRFSHHWFVDEAQIYVAQDEQSFSALLSQARKYGVSLIMAHQNWSQIPEQLKGSLGNVSYEVVFKQSRDDAERSAKQVGRVNPMEVKHEVEDEAAVKRSHPTFSGLPEQWERWAQRMQDLGRGEAFVRDPADQVRRVQTFHVPLPQLDPNKLEKIEQWYLKYCFKSQQEVEQELEQLSVDEAEPTTPAVVRFD